MEERSFQLNDQVVVEDDRGQIGSGVIVGRAFDNPMKYDVRIDGAVYVSIPQETLRYVQ